MEYTPHPVFAPDGKELDHNLVIWRYFDLAKFISMLQKSALYFSRSDLLGDEFEGSYPSSWKGEVASWQYENEIVSPDRGEALALRLRKERLLLRRCVYVNCWHEGDYESAAMWNGYGNGSYAIAVRSTYGKLRKLLPASPPIPDIFGNLEIGRVRYVDYDKLPSLAFQDNLYRPYVHKSLAFQNEREIRAVFMARTVSLENYMYTHHDHPLPDNNAPGHFLQLELNALIDQIIVSPLAKGFFSELVEKLCETYGVSVGVSRSVMSSKPTF